MFETAAELDALQALLDASMGRAGAHLTSIVTDGRTLSARQVAAYLQGVKHVSLATVSSANEPIVAPLDGWFIHGQFVIGTAANSLRGRHIARRPAVSACHVDGDNVGIWVHGRAVRLAAGDPVHDDYVRAATEAYGVSPYSLGDDILIARIAARAMFAYAFTPANFPDEPRTI